MRITLADRLVPEPGEDFRCECGATGTVQEVGTVVKRHVAETACEYCKRPYAFSTTAAQPAVNWLPPKTQ